MHGLERHPLVAGRTIAWHARVYERDGQRCTAGPTTFRLPSGIMVDCDVPLLQLLIACDQRMPSMSHAGGWPDGTSVTDINDQSNRTGW